MTHKTRPQVMGIINVTPDSFSDGGDYNTVAACVARAKAMLAAGVDILDLGAESTRPGSVDVDETTELARLLPVIAALRAFTDAPISIDTTKAEVMRQTVAAGANIINDINALQSEGALAAAADLNVPVCVMHMQGRPRSMQHNPSYQNVVTEVYDFLQARIDACLAAGIQKHNIIIDVGLGFGKSVEHNYQLLAALPHFASLGCANLVGLSRKSMLGAVVDKPPKGRVAASVAGAVLAAVGGADIIRVHDFEETIDAIKVFAAYNAAR